MKKYHHLLQKTRLISFLVGFICCLLGVLLIAYLGKSNPDTPPNAQALPEHDNQAVVITPAEPTIAPNPPLPPATQDQGTKTLGVVHGFDNTHLLTAIPNQYTTKNELVHQNVLNPLLSLIHAAAQDGINISVVSAYRSYDRQKQIWEKKWGNHADTDLAKAKEILRFSSFPGTSRHHWGTDVDFNSVSPDYWKSGEGKRVYQWLSQNASRFGFCQTYGAGRTLGYEEEAWHWSHLPTANDYYAQISQPAILDIALSQPVKGAVAVRQMSGDMMDYITSISPCQPTKNYVAAAQPLPPKANTAPKPHFNTTNPKPPLGDMPLEIRSENNPANASHSDALILKDTSGQTRISISKSGQ